MSDGNEDAKKFFYVYENMMMKRKTDGKKANKLVAFLKADTFDYFIDYFTEGSPPSKRAKSFQPGKKPLL